MKIQVNLGMGNNPMRIDSTIKMVECILTLNQIYPIQYRVDVGSYNGETEDTIIFKFSCPEGKLETLKVCLSAICLLLNQECLALKVGDNGELIFNPTYSRFKYEFDEQYFINF